MPRRKSKNLEVEYCEDGHVSIKLNLAEMRPKRGRGYRSILYHEGNIKGGGMIAFLKLWRPVTRSQRAKILKQFHKNMVAAKSPKII
jgi:hypothetical protein